MKRFLYKIASILMALMVLLSTFSFTVEKHYCGDFLVDISFVGDASSCGGQQDISSEMKIKSCCKDEIEHLKGQDELLKKTIEELTFNQQKSLVIFAVSFLNVFEEIQLKKEYFKDFPPPNLYQNYQVLHQSFLI
jgi:hypothetical protein